MPQRDVDFKVLLENYEKILKLVKLSDIMISHFKFERIKAMKRILNLLFAMVAAFAVCLTLGSCDNDHTHKYKTEWSSDEDFHWYACESDGCTSKSQRAEHTFEEDADAEGNAINLCTVCGYVSTLVNTAGPHDHVYETEYTKGANFHWYACTTEGCTERKDREEHDFAMPEIIQEANAIKRIYTCSLCGYEKTETTVISSVVEGEVSWTQAFENLELVNFDMDVYMTFDNETQHNHCITTPDGVYYQIPGYREFYSVKNSDGSYTTYAREAKTHELTDSDPFYKLSDTSGKYAAQATTETVLAVSFADNYDNFTYDAEKGAYVCSSPIKTAAYSADGTPYPMEMYCYNNVVKVADGKISYISADYYFVYPDGSSSKDEGVQSSFTYANIGMCTVTVPKSVSESAISDPDYVFTYGQTSGPSGDTGNSDNQPNYGAPDGPQGDVNSGSDSEMGIPSNKNY